MSASKWTSCLCLLSCLLCCSISEDPQQLLLTAYSGRDVTLSCQAPDNVAISVVEWMRFDPKRHVYTKRDGHVVTADQDPSYKNRVQLKDDEMKNGDLSLVLKKVKSSDEGAYNCSYKEETRGWIKLISIVYLKVKDQQIPAHPGDDVTLPCQALDNVNMAAVEWSRSDLEKHVFLKSDGHLDTADQHPSYVNRVQLNDEDMKNSDLSLVLKKVTYNDGGTYVCRCREERGGSNQMKLINIIYLTVEGPGDGDTEGGRYSMAEKLSGDGKYYRQHFVVILLAILNGFVILVAFIGFVILKKLNSE